VKKLTVETTARMLGKSMASAVFNRSRLRPFSTSTDTAHLKAELKGWKKQ